MKPSPESEKKYFKIAIIDPEIETLDVLRNLFQKNGLQPAVFGSGLEALSQLSSIQPDLVLMEITLKGEDGLAVCQAIHQRKPETPIIILSNLRDPEMKLQAIEAGAIDYLTKPYDRVFLLKKIRNLLSLLKQRQFSTSAAVSPIMALLNRENLSIIKPEPNPQSPFGYSYPLLSDLGIKDPEDQREALEELVENGQLEHLIFDMVKQCPKCHSININFRPVCPECHSPAIQPIPVPGKSVQQPFQGKKFKCLHCGAVFSTSEIYGKCLNCGENFRESEAETRLIYSYKLPTDRYKSRTMESPAAESILEKALQESEIDYFAPNVFKALVDFEIKQVRASEGEVFSSLRIDLLNLKEIEKKYDPFSQIRQIRNFLLIVRKILRPQDQVVLGGENTFYILMPGTSGSVANLVKKQLLSFIERFGFGIDFRVFVETFPDTFQTIEEISSLPGHSYSSLKKSANHV